MRACASLEPPVSRLFLGTRGSQNHRFPRRTAHLGLVRRRQAVSFPLPFLSCGEGEGWGKNPEKEQLEK